MYFKFYIKLKSQFKAFTNDASPFARINSWHMKKRCCVRPGIQSEDQNQFFTFKVRTFWQSEVKISVLALWLCALSSLFHNMGVVGGYGRNPLFVRARHVQRCVKKCPHFECVIHRFVLVLNAWTNTLYTRVYIVSSLWMPGQVGGHVLIWIIFLINACAYTYTELIF